ncbi:Hexadecenal dehydrogenase [Lithohypha guttulata]|uniref:Aldehyde dehydrogenase n=1 Tax=Lithohypha guttulata TaxID=1690604 RepID=A0AAN7SUE6_9EURO|nr:Hexadecenal dehydrogenase [Lithohypha guttulata]
MGAELLEFKTTPVGEINSTVERIRQTFWTAKTRNVQFRIKQLRKLYWAIEDNKQLILDACKKDLGKGFFETMIAEIAWVQNDIIYVTNNLAKWCKDESAPDISLANKFMRPKIRKDPLGMVLVIGAFNFPLQLSFGPMVGAISGGNTVILKPSENSPRSAMVMQKIMQESLDPDCYTCIQGSIPEMKVLLEEKWDKIFFTGSATVGKIITKAAAPHLTPVVLELGGRNPAIVTRKADVALAARRLLWAKTMNAGQVCISHNYTLVDKEVLDQFVEELKRGLTEFFPKGAKASEDYGRMVNTGSFNRVKKMLDGTTGKIVAGGTVDAEDLFIEPTVIVITDTEDSLMRDESFGPLMPVLGVDNLDQAIHIANKTHETPLGVYAFGSKDETDKVLASTRSGGASINDGMFHGTIGTLAFGGVGDSGSGSYRGKASFDTFVHHRSITHTPGWIESMLKARYPPFAGTNKYGQLSKMLLQKPNFDREGNQKLGWITWIFTLGTGGYFRGASRALILAGMAVLIRVLMDRRTMNGILGKD